MDLIDFLNLNIYYLVINVLKWELNESILFFNDTNLYNYFEKEVNTDENF